MIYQLVFIEEIREEIASAYNWYEKQRTGLGDEFLDELDSAFNLLKSNPLYFSFIYKSRRRVILKRFPYKIVYEVLGTDIIIYSIRHSKQKDKL